MRILVTGAAGYLGGHVVARLAQSGHDVTALVRDSQRASPWLAAHARPLACDLSEPLDHTRLAGHDACVHLAVLWPEHGAHPELAELSASVRLFDALGAAGVAHVVYASSAAAHRPFVGRMSEADRLVTADAYGAAKASGEHFLHASASTHGFRASVVRPGPCVGLAADPGARPRTPGRIAELARTLAEGRAVRVVDGEGRQLTACVDFARTVERVIADPTVPPLLVCVDRAMTSWADVARELARSTGREALVELVRGADETARAWFDTSAIERVLGEPLDARDALREHLASLVGQDA